MTVLVALGAGPLVGPAGAGVAPRRGALLGAYVNPDDNWTTERNHKREVRHFESIINRKLKINHRYYDWQTGFPTALERWDIDNGRIPFLTWEPWGATLTEIITGIHDDWIRERARGLRDLDAPVFLRWAHEMNGTWYPWGGPQNHTGTALNGPDRWIQAYRHIHNIFRNQNADNVIWVWGPNVESVPNTDWNQWGDYYPGDRYVDWVGVSGFNWGTSRNWSSWKTFREIYDAFYRRWAPHKKIFVGETASVERGGNKARWIRTMAEVIKQRFPRIKALVWFHAPAGWPITTSRSAKRAFREVANDPPFKRR